MVTVISSDGMRYYFVTPHSCTCPDYQFRKARVGGKCKHMLKLFYPHLLDDGDRPQPIGLEAFRNGMNIDDAYEKFGEGKINVWLDTGEICKSRHTGKELFWLLE